MTTTFADIKLTEDTEYRFENQKYSWNKGDVISLPQHTARKFVHNWDMAEWTDRTNYEIRDEEYEEIAARVRNKNKDNDSKNEKSYNELQEIAQEHDVKANQSRENIEAALDEKGVDY